MVSAILRYTFAPIATLRIRSITGREYLPRTGAAIIAFNHVSYVDPPILGSVVLRAVGRQPLFPTTTYIADAFGWFGRAVLGMLRIDPTNPRDVLEPAMVHLSHGGLVGIFPEGHRNATDTLTVGKTGVARLALMSGAPVIPVGYRGPGGRSTGEAVRDFLFSNESIVVRIGEPLRFPQEPSPSRERLHEVTDTIMRRISELSGKHFTPRRDAGV